MARSTLVRSFFVSAALSITFVLQGAVVKKDATMVSNKDVDFQRDIQPIFSEHCYRCHGADKQKNGLRLDKKSSAFAGGDSGKVILSGKSSESLLVKLVSGGDPERIMPPKGARLTGAQIGLLRHWIDSGAPWPDDSIANSQTNRVHWSFQRPIRPTVPPVKHKASVRNPIDAFVLARLEKERISPSPEASRDTLIRRLYLDLIVLLPTPEEVSAFEKNPRSDAYESLVNELLASPHFGERWGRHWLDLARYGDSEGYQVDKLRPFAYLYRDWVIRAVNDDMPFNEFTIEQIAGDLLPNATPDQRIAAGFHRNTLMNYEDGIDTEEFRCKAKVDRVATTGTVWLGLTIGCAECHSHKYDPISQREFYELYAFFNECAEADVTVPDENEKRRFAIKHQCWEKEDSALKTRLADFEKEATIRKGDTNLQASIARMKAEIDEHAKEAPAFVPPLAMSFAAMTNPPPTYIHLRGDHLSHGEPVRPGVPEVLNPLRPRAHTNSCAAPDRLDLANWLIDPANPLVGRVAANQIWKQLFGRGLVATEDDFGTQGERPSHPELLDWLATEFAAKWSRKEMIRLIVNSATYRQSSQWRDDLAKRDPLNVLLARQNRLHVESEIVRDIHLQAGGLLNTEIGGPSIRPPLPADIMNIGYHFISAVTWPESHGPDLFRRGIYIQSQRTVPYPLAMTFDAPDSSISCTRRSRSNTPVQALGLLNNAVFFESAQALGAQLYQHSLKPQTAIESAFEICLSRQPSKAELNRLVKYYERELELNRANENVRALIGGQRSTIPDPARAAACVATAHLIMNLDEFLTRE